MNKTKKNKSTVVRYIVISMWVLFVAGVLSIAAIFMLIAKGKIGYMPPIEELENPKNKYASEIFSSDMKVIGRFFKEKENRVYVSYNELSPYLVKALIATEDIRFTKHSGIDVKANCIVISLKDCSPESIARFRQKVLDSPMFRFEAIGNIQWDSARSPK